MTHPPAVMRIRAQAILSECVSAGTEVTHDALSTICRTRHAKDTPYLEREEIITQALELHVAQRRGEETKMSDGQLNTAEVRMHARDFFRKNPEASSPEAWEYVGSIGTPSIKFVSFQNSTCVDVRKELGISGPKGGGKRRRKRGTATESPAKVRTKAKMRAGVASGEAKESATPVPDATAPAAQEPTPERVSSEPQASIEVELADDRDHIALETPGGRLDARHEGRGTWFVEFRGAVETDLLHAMVADLVGPFTAGAREQA